MLDKSNKPILIDNWTELSKIPQESETHILKIELECGSGNIYSKTDPDFRYYLSTHTFYGNQYKESTRILRKCGFNVTLANWDE